MKIAGIVVLAALAGWFARGIGFEEEAAPPSPAPTARVVAEKSEPAAEPPAILQRVPPGNATLGTRNLFAYRLHEQRVPVLPAAEPSLATPQPAAVPEPAVVDVAAAREPVPFPWLYIGTFGSASTRVAAFKRDRDIVTVRPGERVGEFVVRSIGPESVEVDGPDGRRRIPLATGI